MPRYLLLVLSILFIAIWAGCSLPVDHVIDPTRIYQTALASLIPAASQEGGTTASPAAGTAEAGAPDGGTSTAVADEGTAAVACDRAMPGVPIDVTVPDGEHFKPGESFTKTWRLQNVGGCTWTSEYAIVWFSGDLLEANQKQFLRTEVLPGQTVDISVDMTAPETPGVYQGNWKLLNAEGNLFGIGPSGVSPFWVRIEVVAVSTPSPQPMPTETPLPPIFVGGMIVLSLEDGLDLDSGLLNNGTNDDLKFWQDAQGTLLLTPQNGARMAVYNMQAPRQSECEEINLGADDMAVMQLEKGIYLCYRSDRGFLGYIRVETIDLEQVSVEYMTWSLP